MQKAIGNILDKDFFVPYYQRGYRWGEEQVVALLNDLLEFYKHIKKKTEGYNYYSLQPLVVKKDLDDKFRVIDGQQRLTTIYIILNAFESFAQTKDKNKYKLSYDREGSENFLQDIKNDLKGMNFTPYIGAEYNLDTGMFFDVRGYIGITDLSKNAADGKITNGFIQLGLGYKFGK